MVGDAAMIMSILLARVMNADVGRSRLARRALEQLYPHQVTSQADPRFDIGTVGREGG